jgi:hypothetical protein
MFNNLIKKEPIGLYSSMSAHIHILCGSTIVTPVTLCIRAGQAGVTKQGN